MRAARNELDSALGLSGYLNFRYAPDEKLGSEVTYLSAFSWMLPSSASRVPGPTCCSCLFPRVLRDAA